MRNKLREVYSFAIFILAAFIFPIFSFAQQPLKVFILAGQSNMVGHGEVFSNANRRAIGSLEYEVAHDQSGLYKNVVDEECKEILI